MDGCDDDMKRRCDRTEGLHDAIDEAIGKYIEEWDLTYTEVIGVLELIKMGVFESFCREGVDDG
jgi:hypothetical protein